MLFAAKERENGEHIATMCKAIKIQLCLTNANSKLYRYRLKIDLIRN